MFYRSFIIMDMVEVVSPFFGVVPKKLSNYLMKSKLNNQKNPSKHQCCSRFIIINVFVFIQSTYLYVI